MATKSELTLSSEASEPSQIGSPNLKSAESSTESGGNARASGARERIIWIDHVKALGIFLVVFGHAVYHQPVLTRWIYAFHIPLFFLISGFLLKESHLSETFGAFVRRGAKSLLLPYLGFAVIGYIFWFFVERKFGQGVHAATPPLAPVWAALYGTGKPEHLHVEPLVLWFLPCLFVAQTLFYLVHRAKGNAPFLSIALCAIGMVLPTWLALPFQTETALVAQAFILLGFEAKRRKWLAVAPRNPLLWGFGLLALGTVFALLNYDGGLHGSNIDMRGSVYCNVLMFLVSAVSLSLAFVFLFMKVPRLSLTEVISRNTLFIFSFHPMVFSILSAFYVFVLKQHLSFREILAVGLVSSVLNLLLLAYGVEALTRAFPRLSIIKR